MDTLFQVLLTAAGLVVFLLPTVLLATILIALERKMRRRRLLAWQRLLRHLCAVVIAQAATVCGTIVLAQYQVESMSSALVAPGIASAYGFYLLFAVEVLSVVSFTFAVVVNVQGHSAFTSCL